MSPVGISRDPSINTEEQTSYEDIKSFVQKPLFQHKWAVAIAGMVQNDRLIEPHIAVWLHPVLNGGHGFC